MYISDKIIESMILFRRKIVGDISKPKLLASSMRVYNKPFFKPRWMFLRRRA